MIGGTTFSIFATVSCIVFFKSTICSADNAVMSLESDTGSPSSETFCITYNPLFKNIAKSKEYAEPIALVNLTDPEYNFFCNAKMLPPIPHLNRSVAAVLRGNCSFTEKAALAQSLGAAATLIVSSTGLSLPDANSSQDYNSTKIIVAMISAGDFDSIKTAAGGHQLFVRFYVPALPGMDLNLVCIWLLAMFIVVTGSIWSGTVRHQIWLHKQGVTVTDERLWRMSEQESKVDLKCSPQAIVCVVVVMCGMLLGLYFLYDYLIYVIIALFAWASTWALYDCIWSVWLLMPPFASCRIPPNRLLCLKKRPEVRQLVLFVACLSIAIWWFVERHKSYAWVLQDLLGVAFCIHIMKKMRLNSLKMCTILLILLFIYDIFFVFITPLFTKNGSSVMLDVATGRGSTSGETIPVVLLFPRFFGTDFSLCFRQFSLLGFGDVIVPGLLVSYCYGFDLQVCNKCYYLLGSAVGYGVGLVVTFVALALMQQGQPALLYLVPCTLTTVIFMALARKQFQQMWTGKPETGSKKSSDESDDAHVSQLRLPGLTSRHHDEEKGEDSSAGEEDLMLGMQNK